jgi:hypothetical protein
MTIAKASVIFALACKFAAAEGIPVSNPSFETPHLKGPGLNTQNGIPNWPVVFTQAIPGEPSTVITGVIRPEFTTDVPNDGTQLGYINSKSIVELAQPVPATLEANLVYTLSVDFFVQLGSDSVTGEVALCVGTQTQVETCLAVDNSPLPGPATRTVQFLAQPGDPHLGKQLWIKLGKGPSLGTTGSIVLFDNIRLDRNPPLNTSVVLHGAFGSFGIIPGESGRLNALCDGSVMPATCEVTLEFHDIHGVLLNQSHLVMPPGESGFLDLPPDSRGAEPMEIVPVWFLKSGHVVTSFDVFDEDLRNKLFINWGDGSVSKMGQLASGPAFLSRGESARLKAYCDGSVRTSCLADFSFHNERGTLLKQSRLMLPPGTGGFLDLNFEETNSTDRQVKIIPSLMVGEAPAVGGLALIDEATSATITQSYPSTIQSASQR